LKGHDGKEWRYGIGSLIQASCHLSVAYLTHGACVLGQGAGEIGGEPFSRRGKMRDFRGEFG